MTKTMESDETRISLIGKDIEYIKKDVTEIKQSVRELAGVYATQVKLDEASARIEKLEQSSNLWKWLSPTLAAVMGSIMTFLIISFLINQGVK